MHAMQIEMSIQFPLRVVVYPAPDLQGQWIAHGLETDIVTQGDSVEHAIEMMADAVGTLAEYHAERGLFPLRLVPAPREVWDLVGLARPSGVLATVSVRPVKPKPPAKAGRREQHPGAYPIYSFVSDRPPATANAG